MRSSSSPAFTLIELLVVIAIIAVLAVVVVLVLNPSQLLKQSRDSERLSDAATLKSALGIYAEDVGGSMGSSSIVYVSIPDPLATSTAGDQCQGLNLPSAASDTYQCASSSSYHNVNGTGWIPINLKNISIGSPISALPIDPVNTSSSGEFYTYITNGTLYETTMSLESSKDALTEASDGGQYSDLYEQGTNLALAPIDFYAGTGGSGGGGSTCGSYTYYRVITIPAQSSLSGNLSSYPLIISGTYSYLATVANGGLVQNANGYDVGFFTNNTCSTKLPWETETYTAASGLVNYWVQVPTISNSSPVTFVMAYDNSGISTDQSNKTGTWDGNFWAVYHLPDGTTLTYNDSTISGNNFGIAGTITAAGGKVGGGANFASGAWLSDASPANEPTGNSARTISAWVNYTSNNDIVGFFGHDAGAANGFGLQITSSNHLHSEFDSGNGGITGSVTLSAGTWYYVVATYSGSTTALYVNGTLDTSGSYSGAAGSGGNVSIGTWAGCCGSFVGIMDEARFSNVARSADWVKEDYLSQSSPSTFYSVGSQL